MQHQRQYFGTLVRVVPIPRRSTQLEKLEYEPSDGYLQRFKSESC